MLLLLVGGAFWGIKKQKAPTFDVPHLEKSTEIKKEEQKDSTSTTTTLSPPIPTPEISQGELNLHLDEFLKNLNTTSPEEISTEEVQNEIKYIQSFLDEEDIVQRLNANEVSQEDRIKLNQIFLRLQSLKEVRIARTLSDLEKDVKNYQKIHAQRVKKYVPTELEDIN